MLRGDLLVRTAEKQYAVLPVFVNLNYRMTARHIGFFDKMNVDPVSFKLFNQAVAVRADTACVKDPCACSGKGDGLVKSLTAAEVFQL